MSQLIGYSLIAAALGLTIYLLIDEEIQRFKSKKNSHIESEKDRRFDFIFRNIQASRSYYQIANTERLIETHLKPSDQQDSRYQNAINALRKTRIEIMNRNNEVKISELCSN